MFIYSRYGTSYKGKRSAPRLGTVNTRKIGLFILISSTILLVLLKLVTWLNAQEMFTLKDIRIEGIRYTTADELLGRLELETGHNLFDYDLKEIAEKVKAHPFVKQVWVSRRLPDDIIIRVQEKEPLAIFNGETLTPLDHSGYVLPQLHAANVVDLPVISNQTLPESGKSSYSLDRILAYLAMTQNKHFSLYSQISEISYTPELGIYFYLIDFAIPVIVGDGEFENKSEKLVEVLKIIKKEENFPTVRGIDLRYKDQVVVKQVNS